MHYNSISCFSEKIFSKAYSFSMISFPPREANDNRRAAGAVCVIRDQRLVLSLNPSDIVGPAGRHFCLFSVFCGLFISVH